jgi:C-terminal processing protease CtpA/Prc
MRLRNSWIVLAAIVGGQACGSSSDNGSSSTTWQQGVFPPSANFQAQCAKPRTGTDPGTGRPFPDKTGSTLTENNWLRSWTNELYLWYREVPDQNPANYSTVDYFNLLKTTATTASGNPKDRFHFTYDTAQWEALSQSGVSAGYGVQWVVLSSRPPRNVVAAYTDPGTPAAAVSLARGAKVLQVDGVDLVNATDSTSVGTLNEGLFPTKTGASHTFSVLDLGSSTPRDITMVASNVTETPVQNVGTVKTNAGRVGYMLFNDHIATAEPLLISGFSQLQGAGVSDLVLDIRYNGGGYLDIASEVAYMIAGPGPTAGKGFEKTVFNDKNPTKDPVTGQALTPVPFHATSQGFSGPSGQPLPTLSLPRVFVLTGPNTCSASESIINGLRGVGVDVIQVGSTTCGKPYGFYPQDNCGTTYFSIEFQGVNAQGFGDYPDGFSPSNTVSSGGVRIPGCSVGDDFGHDLGDPSEARFSAALDYRGSQSCPAAASASTDPDLVRAASSDGLTHKSPWRMNRILRRPNP